MPKSLLARVRLMYFPLDLVVGILIPLAFVNGLGAADFGHAMVVLYALGIGRTLVIMYGFGRVFGTIERWIASAPNSPDPREIQTIDDMIRRGPERLTRWVGGAWACQLITGMLVLLFLDPNAAISPRAVASGVLMCLGVVLGSIPFTVPLMSVWLNDPARAVFQIAHKAAIPFRRDRTSLKFKLLALMLATAMGPPVWVAATSVSVDTDRVTGDVRMQCAVAASDLTRRLATVEPTDTAKLSRLASQASTHGLVVSISNRKGELLAGTRTLSPVLVTWLGMKTTMALLVPTPGTEAAASPDDLEATESAVSPRDAEVAARAVASNGLVAVVRTKVPTWTSGALVITLVSFFLVLIAWAPVCAIFLSMDVLRPLHDITRAVQQITEVGKLDEVATVPVTQNDETGVLATKFNELVDTLRGLSAAAGALAQGDLEIRIAGDGDVATAFRAMIESLGRIVRQIHETSILLAAAATEIYASSQEQEAAAASQSTAMAEIRQTMESLFEAAAHVAESVRGVLSNAERTLETTDRMVVRIGDLTTHAGRIGEILETIRDISDRSDLLALNGALEASRAGESGRGFGLVAGEMRRLAERVMSSVHDVRSLVGDIRASGSSTMMATEDSKKLAASTTDAARQITMVTQQQRSGTEQVLQSVREIAETLAQSVAAMAQSRSSAEQLKSQADKLSGLVRAFRIKTTST
jgi:methyl-accepting chemotaxis protein